MQHSPTQATVAHLLMFASKAVVEVEDTTVAEVSLRW